MKLKAIVEESRKDGVKLLIIESDENDINGFFLYYCVQENNCFDTWHKTLDDAYDAAFMQYGTMKEDWLEVLGKLE